MGDTNDVSSSLEVVRDSARRLNEFSDRAAQTVRAVEDYLNEQCSVGVEAFVTVSNEEDGQHGWWAYRQLRYCRVGQRFRIAVAEGDASMPEEEVIAWSDCKRDVKLETIQKLPELLASVGTELNKRIVAAESAVALVEQVLGTLKSRAK